MTNCGGCAGLGSHQRWCRAVTPPRAALLGPLSEKADFLGDAVGSNDPGSANMLYQVGARLKRLALEDIREAKEREQQ